MKHFIYINKNAETLNIDLRVFFLVIAKKKKKSDNSKSKIY